MTRYKAAFIHFLISFSVIGSFLTFAYFIWYGAIYLDISGVMVPAKVLIGVDVVLGPLFTLLVFKQGKRHLKLDLSIIALVQLAAFIYGAYTLYLGKPSLIVLTDDVFEIVTQKNIEPELNNDIKKQLGLFSSPQYASVNPNKLIKQQPAILQQAFFVLIDFSQDWVKGNQVTITRVINELGSSKTEVINKVGSENMSVYEFYLMHDTFLNAVLVVRDNTPYKIIHTPKK